LLASFGLITRVTGHSYNLGACPQFIPMPEFDWEKFSNGTWYPVAKTSTSGRCLTENFVKNENGFKSLKQTSQSPVARSLGLNEETELIGRLSQPEVMTRPSNMIIEFPLNMLGASSFVVVMTDYSQSALTCTCQDAGFLGLYVNRRSCSVLQRQPQLDQQLLDEALKLMKDQESLTPHDLDHLDIIDQENCIYGGRPLTINVNNISDSLNF